MSPEKPESPPDLAHNEPEVHPPIRSYGRIGGRALSARQKRLLDERLPEFEITLTGPGALDPNTLFKTLPDEIWLEIGFGGGEHMIGQARHHPNIGLIGCEPYIDGMVKALSGIETADLHNVRLYMEDARGLLAALKANSLARIFILFPDPWPKKRQQKRRLIQVDFLDTLARVLKPGGELRFATDVASYANEALAHFIAHPAFDWTAERAEDWRVPPVDHMTTRYEVKQLGDCRPVWFEFRKTAGEFSVP